MTKKIVALIFLFASSVAYSGIAVIVAKSASTGDLTIEDIKDIFIGASKTFPNGDRAVPCAHKNSKTANEFYKGFAGISAKKAKAKWTKLVFTGRAKKPKSVGDDEEAVDFVKDTSGGICFVKSSSQGGTQIVAKK